MTLGGWGIQTKLNKFATAIRFCISALDDFIFVLSLYVRDVTERHLDEPDETLSGDVVCTLGMTGVLSEISLWPCGGLC